MSAPQSERHRRTKKEYLGLFGSGIAMGSADVVPGVSGGTMAFILGIYEELLDAISSLNATFIRRLLKLQIKEAFSDFAWPFLVVLGLGIFTAILTLAQFLTWALDTHPTLVWGFFFGLIVASVVVIRQRVRGWTPATILIMVASAVGMYLLVGMVPAQTPDAGWFLFLTGALVICGMILPGISGAFIMVLLGKYEYVLNALVTADIGTLAIVAAGAVVGLLSIVRLLRWLFRHYHDPTVAALMGLMIGSLRKIWPWKETLSTTVDRHGEVVPLAWANVLPEAFTSEVAMTAGLAILGFIVVVLLDHFAGAPETQGTPQAILIRKSFSAKMVKRVLLAIAGIILLLLALARPAPDHPFFANLPRPLAIAHQGGDGLWPGDTLFAFQRVAALGVDVLEMDVHSTADGVLVLMHDDTVDRTTDGSGPITEKTLPELKALDAGYDWSPDGGQTHPFQGKGITVPTLEEVFNAFPGFPMNIEIKQDEPSIAEPFCRLIRTYGMTDKVLVGSFHDQAMGEFRAAAPEVATSTAEQETRDFFYRYLAFLGATYSPIAHAVQVPERRSGFHILTPRFVRSAHGRNIEIHAWTINEVADMQRLLDLGVDGIITDYPDRLLDLLGR